MSRGGERQTRTAEKGQRVPPSERTAESKATVPFLESFETESRCSGVKLREVRYAFAPMELCHVAQRTKVKDVG